MVAISAKMKQGVKIKLDWAANKYLLIMVGPKVFSTKQGYLKCLWDYSKCLPSNFSCDTWWVSQGKKWVWFLGEVKALGAGLYWIYHNSMNFHDTMRAEYCTFRLTEKYVRNMSKTLEEFGKSLEMNLVWICEESGGKNSWRICWKQRRMVRL
jgi:hypothetical protein